MKKKAWLLLLCANLFWAGNMIFGKFSTSEFPAIWVAFLRWAVALIFLIPIAHFAEKPPWLRLWKKNWRMIVLLGTLNIVVYCYLSYASLQFTSATNGALINTLTPALIMLFSFLLLKEKGSIFQSAGLITSFIGVLTVLTKGQLLQLFHTPYNKGDLLMFLGVLCFAAYSLLVRRTKGIPAFAFVAMMAMVGTIVMIPVLFLQPIQAEKVTPLGIAGIIYLGIFPSIGSQIFWNHGIKVLGASKTGITMNLVPIFTAIISVILGQALALSQIIGGLLTIAGMVLTSAKGRDRSPERKANAALQSGSTK
ncbi:DMT family transporter [Paenibacillus glycinis]|uniref:EamA family transporter n=1 Tax=Paenibacillus glycinis TaxID=2697035 RepID=A0ABW9XQG2_9BACL|nr:DMT family transporter [Paenibacillus glycinis]NBD24865.1 EamA family transporter [Paenibacillus glycinis]